MNTLSLIELLPRDMIIIIAKYVYGDDKVVVRKDGHVSFRILKIEPCLSKIRKFSVYLFFDTINGTSHVKNKTIFLGKKTVRDSEIGWDDETYHNHIGFLDEDRTPSYRSIEYSITIRCDANTKQVTYEYVSCVYMYFYEKPRYGSITDNKLQKYLVNETDRGQHYIKSNRIL
jgi:hypothetical protein